MSLVAQLVKEFRGHIEVTSEKGRGTTMVVTIPIDFETVSFDSESGREFNYSEYSVGFVGTQSTAGHISRRVKLTDAARRTPQHIGVHVIPFDGAATAAILEADFVHLQSHAPDSERRWLVLCNTFASATQLRARSKNSVCAEFVPQPYGLDRLSAAIRKLCTIDSHDSVAANPSLHSRSVVDKQPVSLGDALESTVPALPSLPLEVSLEHMNFSATDRTAVKAPTAAVGWHVPTAGRSPTGRLGSCVY